MWYWTNVSIYVYIYIYIYTVECSRYRPDVAQRLGRVIALLFHDRGTRRGWVVSSTPRPHFTPGKDPVAIVQEAGWTPGPVWTGGKSRSHRDSIPDRPTRSQSLYLLSYLAHTHTHIQGYSKWLSGFKQLVIHNKLGIAVCSCTDRSRGSCSSSSRKYPRTEGTNQNRHWNHHRWDAKNSLERTLLSCWCL